jgi:hypothetical protein
MHAARTRTILGILLLAVCLHSMVSKKPRMQQEHAQYYIYIYSVPWPWLWNSYSLPRASHPARTPNTARYHPPPRTRPVSTIFFLTVGHPCPARCGSFLFLPRVSCIPPPPTLSASVSNPPPHPSPARLRPRRARSIRPRPLTAVPEPPPTRTLVFCCPGTPLPHTFLPLPPCQHHRSDRGDERATPPLPESRSLPCTDGARQREENARHRLCRAHFAQAHDKGRPAHFYPVKNFAMRFGKRKRTTKFFAVRNTRRTAKKRC